MKLDIVVNEFAQSWRGLLRKPGYLILAGFTLALGIATTSAVFSLLDQALLQPLPYPHAERLATLGISNGNGGTIGSPMLYQRLQRLQGVDRTGIVSANVRSANIASGDVAVVANQLAADSGYLDTLGARLAIGRNFNRDEDLPNGPPAVIISHGFWQQTFGGRDDILQRSLQIEGASVPVVGVLPEDFVWPQPFDILVPLQLETNSTNAGTNEYIVARLSAGTEIAAASAQVAREARTVLDQQRAVLGDEGYGYLIRQSYGAQPIIHLFTSVSRALLWLFFGAAACVLLIAAINLTNLMILRTIARRHETAVRTALGAPALRLALPNLSEGVLAGLVGGLGGLLLAWIGLRLLGGWVPVEWLRGREVSFTPATVVFAATVSVAVALLAALLGVWQGRFGDLQRELVGGGRSGPSRTSHLLGRGLVVAQTTIAVVLLVGAALFARSLFALTSVPMGFESERILTFSVSPIRSRYGDISAVVEQSRRIQERLRQLGDVRAVAASTTLPTGAQLNMPVVLPDDRTISPQYRPISSGFFDVFGMPVLAGRAIGVEDTAGSEAVCVVSESFAKAFFGGEAIGRIVKAPKDMNGAFVSMRVVGVVGDVRQFGPDQPAPPIVYLPLSQVPPPIWLVVRDFTPMAFAVKSHGEPARLMPALHAAMREIDPSQPIGQVKPMRAIVADNTSAQRLNLLLVTLFASLSLLLACVGLYAVMSVAVMTRQHEFGVRAALGAQPARLFRLVLGESAVQLGIGLLGGLLISLAISKLLQRFLFGVGPVDPLALTAVLLTLLLAGLAASLVPALRASRVPPMTALRS